MNRQHTRFWGLLLVFVCVWHVASVATLGHVHGPEQSGQDCALCQHQLQVPLLSPILQSEDYISLESDAALVEEPPFRRVEIVLASLVSRGPPSR